MSLDPQFLEIPAPEPAPLEAEIGEMTLEDLVLFCSAPTTESLIRDSIKLAYRLGRTDGISSVLKIGGSL